MLVQERHNSIANALESRHSRTDPSIYILHNCVCILFITVLSDKLHVFVLKHKLPSGSLKWFVDLPYISCVLSFTGLILGLRPANERRRYKVTVSPIGRVQISNQPWFMSSTYQWGDQGPMWSDGSQRWSFHNAHRRRKGKENKVTRP